MLKKIELLSNVSIVIVALLCGMPRSQLELHGK